MKEEKGRVAITPTGVARTFEKHEIIVSKTDIKGIISYANDVFLSVSGYTKEEIIGKPHNTIRHPEMPRCVFKLLWDRLKAGEEIFAYVNNMAKNGDYYWVFAHVTPTFGANKQIIGYHSSRRVPEDKALEVINPLYAALLAEEKKHSTAKAGMEASFKKLTSLLEEKGVSYDEFIFSV